VLAFAAAPIESLTRAWCFADMAVSAGKHVSWCKKEWCWRSSFLRALVPGLILLRVPVLNSAVWSSTRLRATWAGHPRPRAEAYTRLIVERRFMFKDRHRRELSVSDTARVTGHGRKAARRPQEEQGLLAPASRAPPGPQDRPYLFNRRRR